MLKYGNDKDLSSIIHNTSAIVSLLSFKEECQKNTFFMQKKVLQLDRMWFFSLKKMEVSFRSNV